MRTSNRPLRSLLLLLLLLLGLMAAPAEIAAQDDDDDDTTTPAVIAPPGDAADRADADQDDTDTGTTDADRDDDSPGADADTSDTDRDDDPPDCDDGDWAIATTEDGTRFSSEDHCNDHVAAHGEDSLIEIGASRVDAYVDVYVAVMDPYTHKCVVAITPVNGQVGQWVVVGFLASTGDVLEVTIATGSNDRGRLKISEDDFLQAGTAEVVLNPGDEPVGYIPIHMVNGNSVCGLQ